MTQHQRYMRLALTEARAAFELGEVPVGAVIVRDDVCIARAGNRMQALGDPTKHAEMLAISRAAAVLGRSRLEGCTLYVTLEPCPMCAGAIVNARLSQLIFGAHDLKAGAAGTLYTITTDPRLNHVTGTLGGVLDAECAEILSRFFQERRV